MKILAVIQARTGSTRLPRKVLMPLGDRTVLEQVVQRVSAATLVTDTLVATTISEQDQAITGVCASRGIRVFCGSENDVLDRFYQASRLLMPDHIIRITADCPLMDPRVIDNTVRRHCDSGADYTSNTIKLSYPDGEDIEVFTFAALKKTWEQATLVSEREHVTPYIRKNDSLFKIVNVNNPDGDLSRCRWTLDNSEDYTFIKTVYDHLYNADPLFGMDAVLSFVRQHPDIEAVNAHIARNEGYARSLEHDRSMGKREGE